MSGDDGQAIRVLHVDDESNFADLVATYLERANDAFSVVTATSAPEGLDCLDEHRVDCIVSDLDMPEMDGLEFLRAVREEYPDLPFVLFTGKGSEEIASDAISAGVTEYLQKESGTDQYTVLANRIERAVEAYRAKDALEESERMLSTLVSNLPGMAYRCRNAPEWPMEHVSDGCRELTGYDPTELVEGDVVWAEDVLLEEDLQRLWETVQDALDAGESFEVTYRIRTADGETKRVWEQGQGVYEDGDLTALEGIILHIDSPAVRQATRLSDADGSAAVRSARFEAAVERIDDAFVAVDADRTVTYANEAVDELLGMAPDDLVGTDLCTAVPDGYDDILRSQLEQSIATGDPVRSETQYPGSDRWIELNIYPAEDGASLYARDVTDRRERSTELERYRTLVENVGDPMYVLDTDATITMANEAMADHLGYDREEIVGSHASMFMPESDVQTGTERVRRLLEGEETWATFEMETVHADGSRSVNEDKIAVLTDDAGEYVGSVGVMRDISTRKERERELRRYETIIQAVGDPVYALDDEGYFTFVNDAVTELAGYDPADLRGEHATTVVSEADFERSVDYVEQLRSDESVSYVTFEMDIHTADGDTVPTENHIALLEDEDGHRGTAGVIRDISERKRREQRLQKFASVVSHDLQSPLNVITGRAQLAQETGSVEHVDGIVQAADRMETLIEDLLTLARQGRTVGEPESTPLSDAARDAWEQVQSPAATLTVDDEMVLSADPERLRELLVNLFRNAVEHGSTSSRTESDDAVEHGSTGNQTESDDAVEHAGPDVDVTVETLSDRPGFAVADDGPGIPPARRSDVFEHGHTTSDEGSGLGLAIVENIVQAHGWSVDVEESADGGARFVVVTE